MEISNERYEQLIALEQAYAIRRPAPQYATPHPAPQYATPQPAPQYATPQPAPQYATPQPAPNTLYYPPGWQSPGVASPQYPGQTAQDYVYQNTPMFSNPTYNEVLKTAQAASIVASQMPQVRTAEGILGEIIDPPVQMGVIR